MPTYDEKREVARKLRKNADDHENMPLILNVAFTCFDFNGHSEKTVTAREAAHKIADLIEPEPELTCRNLADTKYGEMPEGFDHDLEWWYMSATPRELGTCFLCSNCGAEVCDSENYSSGMYVDGASAEFKRCPNCEAKVVEK